MVFYLVTPEVENDKITKRTNEGTHAAQVIGKFANKAPKCLIGYFRILMNYARKKRKKLIKNLSFPFLYPGPGSNRHECYLNGV